MCIRDSSWVEAPNGQDCLEVCITEYNSSQDGVMIDPEDELEYAYDAIQDLSLIHIYRPA